MIRFLVRRTLLGLLVIWLITLVVFALFFVAPEQRGAHARPAARPPRRPSR